MWYDVLSGILLLYSFYIGYRNSIFKLGFMILLVVLYFLFLSWIVPDLTQFFWNSLGTRYRYLPLILFLTLFAAGIYFIIRIGLHMLKSMKKGVQSLLSLVFSSAVMYTFFLFILSLLTHFFIQVGFLDLKKLETESIVFPFSTRFFELIAITLNKVLPFVQNFYEMISQSLSIQ